MKKISAIVLAIALVMMAAVPFCASADDAVITLTGGEITVAEDGTFTVPVSYETDKNFSTLKIRINFDTEVLTANLPEKGLTKLLEIGRPDEDEVMSWQFNNNDVAKGELVILAACQEGAIAKSGVLMNLPLQLVEGKSIEDAKVTFTVEEMKDADDPTSKTDFITEPVATEMTFKVATPDNPDVPGTDETDAPTEAPTEAPTAAPTTKPASTAGEATPWALLATVAVAGAALVVLSTKKSK